MSWFNFDDPTKTAEQHMSDVLGCIIFTVVALLVIGGVGIFGLVELVRHITWR